MLNENLKNKMKNGVLRIATHIGLIYNDLKKGVSEDDIREKYMKAGHDIGFVNDLINMAKQRLEREKLGEQ